MATRADLINQFKSMLSNRRDYANRTKKYIDQKNAFKEAQKNFKNSIANGEQSVGGGSFTKNPALEKNIRQVNAYNKALTEKGNDAVSKLESDLDKVDKFKKWRELHKGEREASNRFFDRRRREIQEQIDMVDEAMTAAKERGNWDEFHRLNDIYEELDVQRIKLDEMADTPESAMNMELDDLPYDARNLLGNDNMLERELSKRANRITEGNLPNIDNIAKSNVDDIIRFHTTDATNIPYIYKDGLRADKGGDGFGGCLRIRYGVDPDAIGGVYTTSRHPFNWRGGVDDERFMDTYTPSEGQATLQLNIPKKDYRKLNRMEHNPEEDLVQSFDGDHGSLLQTIQNGGRTDIFEQNLKPKYITSAINENGKAQSIEDFIKNYQCDDDCDEWFDALRETGLIKYDPELDIDGWNEPLFAKLRNRK